MPRSNRRRQPRRRPPPRPTYRGAPAEPEEAPRTAATSRSARASRPAAYIARQTPYLYGELRRVVLTSAACFGLLALLIVVDRLQ
jgi:nitroreductase